jgi:hemerythrin superfamily protein
MAVGSIDAFKDCILTEEEKLYRKEREYRREKEFRDLLEAIEQAEEKKDEQLSLWLRQLKKLKYPNRG